MDYTINKAESLENIELYAPYIDRDIARALVVLATQINFKAGPKGGTSYYMPIEATEFALLYSNVFIGNKNFNHEHFKDAMNAVAQLYLDGCSVAPVYGYARSLNRSGIANQYFAPGKYRDIIIKQNAIGRALGDYRGVRNMIDSVRERLIVAQHYGKLAKSFVTLIDSPIKPDISLHNIVFDKSHGYKFIDFITLLKHRPLNHEKDCTEKLIKSFVTNKKFLTAKMEDEYFAESKKEQRLLVTALSREGVKEEYLASGVAKIPQLKAPSLDRLFK